MPHPFESHSSARTDVSVDESRRSGPQALFGSILFDRAGARATEEAGEPDFFSDLNLDQVLQRVTAGRDSYELEPFFYVGLHEPASVRYRQDAVRDLEQPPLFEVITRFALGIQQMRESLERAAKVDQALQMHAWFLDAVQIYGETVRNLASGLEDTELRSGALQSLRSYVANYTRSKQFRSLLDEAAALEHTFADIRYAITIEGPRVTVTRYNGQADYSAEVRDTFAKFQQGAGSQYLVALSNALVLNHIEAQILEGVAELHPEVFAQRAEFCARHRDYADHTLLRFDREVQFYAGYLDMIRGLKDAGLSFCYPEVSVDCDAVTATATFDIALASKLVPAGRRVICNDFRLTRPERILVVSGPNNGGKTTFARTFGQVHHLASLGLPVPGSAAHLMLADHIYTHFERQEEIETLRGKFEDELVRVHSILERATRSSVIVMNESFNSTTLNDALVVGTEVLRHILEVGCAGVYVTFVDELASLSEATVSMVAEIVPGDPTQRTFKIVRKPADGLAYASAIAEQHGLTYERVIERIGT